MGSLFDTMIHRQASAETEVERRIAAVLERPDGNADALSDALLAAADASVTGIGSETPPARQKAVPEPISEPFLARIAELFGDDDHDPRLRFWSQIAARFPRSALLAAYYGDALLMAGREAEAMDRLLMAFEIEPTLVHELDEIGSLAHELGGMYWLRYQIAELRALLAAAEASDDGDDAGDDPAAEVRERYSELLEEYHGHAPALAEIRAVGRRIAELEAAGVLPQVMVRRGMWRPPQ